MSMFIFWAAIYLVIGYLWYSLAYFMDNKDASYARIYYDGGLFFGHVFGWPIMLALVLIFGLVPWIITEGLWKLLDNIAYYGSLFPQKIVDWNRNRRLQKSKSLIQSPSEPTLMAEDE